MTESRLKQALNRQKRAWRRPEVATRLTEAGLAHSFLTDDEQNTLIERFRETATRGQSPWRDFSTIAVAAHWIMLQVAAMPPLTVAIPNGDLDEEPAFTVDHEALLARLTDDPALVSINGCWLFASDGAAALEIFPNHTSEGDVVSVQVSNPLVRP
jgi:hypothetical protein